MTTRTEDREHHSYDPAGEVVDICRDLIRLDTTNFGDGSGPGERKAAENVAALLDEVGIEAEIYEGVAGGGQGGDRRGGRGGAPRGGPLGWQRYDGRPAAPARSSRRGARRGRRLGGPPVL